MLTSELPRSPLRRLPASSDAPRRSVVFAELATCALEGIPVKIAIINNGNLGMVRQWQTL
ncbi:thiamine pyrophosphate-dependent enzyme, partial [Actinoplanes sp. NPDC051470]|uniref:thiamine pyrophosphate-dependent enzyme n=1 Tax=Actinoplanes sp. NPDC051470 TaxID=3157224 RepID=UPI0034383F87